MRRPAVVKAASQSSSVIWERSRSGQIAQANVGNGGGEQARERGEPKEVGHRKSPVASRAVAPASRANSHLEHRFSPWNEEIGIKF